MSATVREALALQYQDADEVWHTVATCDFGTFARTRRLGLPAGVRVSARRWRIIKTGDHDYGFEVITARRLRLWRESEALSAVKRWSFDFDTGEQRYGLIVTEGHVDVYKRGQFVACIASPYTEQQLLEVRRAQSLDTLLAFHREVPPMRFSRQGASTEWDVRAQTFENVPIFDYDGTRAGGVDEVQQLTFVDYVNGETFNLTLEGETTPSIAYSTDMTTLAASVSNALQTLPNIGTGGVTVTSTADKVLRITFTGRNRADDVGELATQAISSAQGLIRVATLTQGKPGGEPVMSETRGWPATGCFYQNRLVLAGLASRPQTILSSRAGFFFDLRIEGAQADKGIDVELATDQSTRILGLVAGRHLQVFTQSAEFFCPGPFTPPPEFVRTSQIGLAPGTPLLDMEGTTLFVAAGRDTVRQFFYDDAAQGYVSEPLSSFHAHLTRDIVAAGFRRHRSTTEPNLAALVREDGSLSVMSALPSQEVLGFVPWTTDGAYVEAGGELAGDLYVIVRREVDGRARQLLERVAPERLLDASVVIEGPFDEPLTVVSGLDHLEGATATVIIDGGDAGDVVIENGAAVLPYAPQVSVEIGRNFEPRMTLMPMVMETDPRAGASMRARTGEIALRLGPSGGVLKAGMTGKHLWPVPMKRRPAEQLDIGSNIDPFSGHTRVYPVPGFQNDAQVTLVQTRPGPLEVQEIVATVTS